ncbi:M10 family metallopeptidase C-terminal domain-containing protein, partial [Granulosicoccus sp.]
MFINRLEGLDGDDDFTASAGADTFVGGAGSDTLDYSNFFSAGSISVTLTGATQTSVIVQGSDNDIIEGVENIIGTAGDDTLTGDGEDNTLDGRAGDDTLSGGVGDDILRGGDGSDMLIASEGADTNEGGLGDDTVDFSGLAAGQSVDVTLTGSTPSTVVVANGTNQTISGIENVIGTQSNDQVVGDITQNSISTLGGDDIIGASAGADILDGGAGLDTIDYSVHTTATRVNVTLNENSLSTVQVTGSADDAIVNIENVIGTDGNDTLIGDSQDNILEGRIGNDFLVGAGGNDTLDGGVGIDTADYSAAPDSINVNLDTGAVSADGYNAVDTIIDVENVIGTASDDVIVGNADANTIDSGAGDDSLTASAGSDEIDGGLGSDTLDYSGLLGITGVSVSLNGASDVTVNVGNGDNDTIAGIENLIGSTAADVFGGDSAANRLEGREGADTFLASAGTDTYLGGDGSDTLDYSTFFAAGAINVQLQGASNSTVFVAGSGDDTISSIENILGTTGNDVITGDAEDNTLDGRSGNDTIDGGAGTDTISGGEGNDTIMASAGADVTDGGDGVDTVDFSGLGGGQSIDVILQGATVSTVTVANGDDQSISNVENIVGTAGDDQITGNEEANIIQSLAGDDMLGASAGADTLDGGAGSDTLDYSGVAGIQSINVTLDDNNVTTVQ